MPIYSDDEDVPFRLPLAEGYTLSDDETEELNLSRGATQPDLHNQPTHPLPTPTAKQSVQIPRVQPSPIYAPTSQSNIPPPLPNTPPVHPASPNRPLQTSP